jgi:hypothetical protein
MSRDSCAIIAGLYINFTITFGLTIRGGCLLGIVTNVLVSLSTYIWVHLDDIGRKFALLNIERRDIGIAALCWLLIIMNCSVMFFGAILDERNHVLLHVESQVLERTQELKRTLAELETAKMKAEELSSQKSTFMVH